MKKKLKKDQTMGSLPKLIRGHQEDAGERNVQGIRQEAVGLHA